MPLDLRRSTLGALQEAGSSRLFNRESTISQANRRATARTHFHKQRSRWLAVSLCLASICGSCVRQHESPAEIPIGLLVDRPSPIADATLEAARLAVSTANAGGGIMVEGRPHMLRLLVEDTGNTPEGATHASLELINRAGAVAIVGSSFSHNAIPSGEIAERAGIPMISPGSTHPQTTAGRRFVFRVSFIDPIQGRAMARFARNELGLTTAAVLYDIADAYSRDIAAVFRRVFEDAGGKVAAFESFTTGAGEFSRQLGRIQDAGAEAVFLPNFSKEIFIQSRELRSLGSDAVLLGSDGWLAPGIESNGALQGAFFTLSWHPDLARTNAAAAEFNAAFRSANGRLPDEVAAMTYDAFGLLFHAIAVGAQANPGAIRDALANIVDYPGVTGPITFRDLGGNPHRNVAIVGIEDGDIRLFKWVAAEPEPRTE